MGIYIEQFYVTSLIFRSIYSTMSKNLNRSKLIYILFIRDGLF